MAITMAPRTPTQSSTTTIELFNDAKYQQIALRVKELALTQSDLDLGIAIIEAQKMGGFYVFQHQQGKDKNSKGGKGVDVEAIYLAHLRGCGEGMKMKMKMKVDLGREKRGEGGRSWGYYQRLGGDERIISLWDLEKSGVPFDLPDPEEDDEDEVDEDEDNGETVKSLGGGEAAVDTETEMVPWRSPEEIIAGLDEGTRASIAIMEVRERYDEDARAFEGKDDEVYAPDVDKPRSPVIPQKEGKQRANSNASTKSGKGKQVNINVRGPAHKKVESLRATGHAKAIGEQVAPPTSSAQQSPYLSALGTSGVAPTPPSGTYNSFGGSSFTGQNAFAAFAISNGLKPGAPGPAGGGRSPFAHTPAHQSPLQQWSDVTSPTAAAATPDSGFYEMFTPGAGLGQGSVVGSGTGASSPTLAYSTRTTSRFQFQQQGNGTPLRADTPVFQSTSTPPEPVDSQDYARLLSTRPALSASNFARQHVEASGTSAGYTSQAAQQVGDLRTYYEQYAQQTGDLSAASMAYGSQYGQQQVRGRSPAPYYAFNQEQAGTHGGSVYPHQHQQAYAQHNARNTSSALNMQTVHQQGTPQDTQQISGLQVLQQGGMQSSQGNGASQTIGQSDEAASAGEQKQLGPTAEFQQYLLSSSKGNGRS